MYTLTCCFHDHVMNAKCKSLGVLFGGKGEVGSAGMKLKFLGEIF